MELQYRIVTSRSIKYDNISSDEMTNDELIEELMHGGVNYISIIPIYDY